MKHLFYFMYNFFSVVFAPDYYLLKSDRRRQRKNRRLNIFLVGLHIATCKYVAFVYGYSTHVTAPGMEQSFV